MLTTDGPGVVTWTRKDNDLLGAKVVKGRTWLYVKLDADGREYFYDAANVRPER